MKIKILIASITAGLGAASLASAAELVTNGDFGSGLSGWTVGDNVLALTGNDYVPCCGTSGTATQMANPFASFGAGNTTGTNTLSQSIATVSGHKYVLSFDAGALGGGSQAISELAGATPLGSETLNANDALGSTFTHYSFTFTATGATTLLTFSNTSFADGIDPIVDNVSVSAVPEPAAWAFMILGVAMAGGMARARRRPATAAA